LFQDLAALLVIVHARQVGGGLQVGQAEQFFGDVLPGGGWGDLAEFRHDDVLQTLVEITLGRLGAAFLEGFVFQLARILDADGMLFGDHIECFGWLAIQPVTTANHLEQVVALLPAAGQFLLDGLHEL
jgi:hypothetical protein